MKGPDGSDALMTEKALALYLGVSVSSLQHDRHNARGITYIKIGSRVRYRWSDVNHYLNAHTTEVNA
jgi:hypothetical protein